MKQTGKMLLLALCLLLAPLWAGQAEDAPVFVLSTEAGEVTLCPREMADGLWLFLPAFAQPEQLSVQGAALEWMDDEPDEDGLWYVDVLLEQEQGETLPVTVMRSQNLRALFLFSDDPVAQGRAYIEDCTGHERTASATLALVDAQGAVNHRQKITALRGRGNWTWNWPKRPYQIKLENSVDLLDTGDSVNRSRTWVLLAECLDSTLLHNRITADLAKEIGLTAMDSEFVDLYYDGDYRGTYLLSEKVEVDEGRVDVLDYEKLLKKWNGKLGQNDLDALSVAEATNRFGNRFTYVQGVVEDSRPNVGAYFVEMESRDLTLSDPCYFTLRGSEHPVYALKNPEHASRSMVTYISERLQEAHDTLLAGGVNPSTGRTLQDDFDVDAFARTMLLQELSYNVDGYTYSSSYFVLRDGETRFEPGPVWDFDLSYRFYLDGRNAGATGFKDQRGWVTDFYRVPDFLERVQELYLTQLYPLICDVLLGDEYGQYLQPLTAYQSWLSASAAMNEKIWGIVNEGRFEYGASYDDEIHLLRRFLTRRSQWLYRAMTDLQPHNDRHIALWLDVGFTSPDTSLRIHTAPWQDIAVEVTGTEQLTGATEEDFALWKLNAVLSSPSGQSLEGFDVTLNGTPLTAKLQEDGTLAICAQYEDRSYRPVDYYGDDVGLIYQYEQYIADYPEVAQACGYDEEAVMDFFFNEGIYSGQVGNGLFDPHEAARLLPHVAAYLYDDWMSYYWEFLSWGCESGWMTDTNARFVPQVKDWP
ncbi:MAG: CotH kinase family protein [Clostridia bacterium]|nr:CotH kinase family protein [Clostridia bacterium]